MVQEQIPNSKAVIRLLSQLSSSLSVHPAGGVAEDLPVGPRVGRIFLLLGETGGWSVVPGQAAEELPPNAFPSLTDSLRREGEVVLFFRSSGSFTEFLGGERGLQEIVHRGELVMSGKRELCWFVSEAIWRAVQVASPVSVAQVTK
ncbi:hypothetical protein MRY87_09005 [bacterium]|nr:hypothetical protein [bacterium]